MSIQISILQSLTGVAQSRLKKEQRQEDLLNR